HPQADDVVSGLPNKAATFEDDRARPRPDQARDGLERGRLAGAVAAQDGDDLSLVDFERDSLERFNVGVEDTEVFHLEKRHQRSCIVRPRPTAPAEFSSAAALSAARPTISSIGGGPPPPLPTLPPDHKPAP